MKRLPLSQTILSLIGVAILIGLGTWQMERLQWKEGIIAKLEADYSAQQDPNAPLISYTRLGELSQEKMPAAVAKVRGRFLREDAVLVGPQSSQDGRGGYHLLVPLQLDNGRVLIVNAGWVDELWKDNTQDRLAVLPQDALTVTGILRKPDYNSFASRNSPANDMWFRADIGDIAQAKHLANPYPFILYASATNPPLQNVEPIDQHWLPRNKHLQYAMFWYAMALTLVGVYGFYWHSRKPAA